MSSRRATTKRASTSKEARVARVIDVWCNKAMSLEKHLSQAAGDFNYLSNTYSDMRDMTSDLKKETGDRAKERIDGLYRNVTETKRHLCEMRAGGNRRMTRRR
jgi:hypothetical protein